MKERVLVAFRMPEDERRRLAAVAAILGETQGAILVAAVKAHLDEATAENRIGRLVRDMLKAQAGR